MSDLAVDLDAEVRAAGRHTAQFGAIPLGDKQPPIDFADELPVLDKLTEIGIVQRDGRRICVTETGRPFVRLVAAAFDAYLPKDQSQHSVAV
jgi:coproporphyrinogen III oxidase-like Fe-S oxidoreductase